MRVTLWGTRGSLPNAGPETVRYGGNTSCVEVRGSAGTVLVLDAGTGIRRLGSCLNGGMRRVDLLLTHLHMDHIQGLGFFGPLYRPDMDVHIWGPPSATMNLRARLARYLSPPLFPVRIRDLPCTLTFHDVHPGEFEIGEFKIKADQVSHPGPTLGFRISENGGALTYMPDHEPVPGGGELPPEDDWISGFALAEGADVLVHDSQYSREQYPEHIGWGHSYVEQTLRFADKAGARKLVTFHHDPAHDDAMLDRMLEDALRAFRPGCTIQPGQEGAVIDI